MSNTRKDVITDAGFFQNQDLNKAEKLLGLVSIANHREIIELTTKVPSIIFLRSTCTTPSGTKEELSALEFAIKYNDMYLCNQFFELVKHDSSLLKQFKEQLRTQLTSKQPDESFTELKAAYSTYSDARITWYEKPDKDECLKQIALEKLKNVGTAQKNLPIWALKKICKQVSGAWDKDTEFNIEAAQSECHASVGWAPSDMLDIIKNISELGTSYFLIRGTGYLKAQALPLNRDLYIVNRDALVFEKLFTQTMQQRESLLLQVMAFATENDTKPSPMHL
jgi:hypothetical protein